MNAVNLMDEICRFISAIVLAWLTSMATGLVVHVIQTVSLGGIVIIHVSALILAHLPLITGLLAVMLPHIPLPTELHWPLHTLMQKGVGNSRIHIIMRIVDIVLIVAITARLLNTIFSISPTGTATSKIKRRGYSVAMVDGCPVRLLPTQVMSCFTTGFYKPEIYHSQGLLDGMTSQHIHAILSHKAEHFKNRDCFCMLILHAL